MNNKGADQTAQMHSWPGPSVVPRFLASRPIMMLKLSLFAVIAREINAEYLIETYQKDL